MQGSTSRNVCRISEKRGFKLVLLQNNQTKSEIYVLNFWGECLVSRYLPKPAVFMITANL